MSLYIIPGISDVMYVVTGERAPAPPADFAYESIMPAPFVSERMGIVVESQEAAPIVQAGEIVNTNLGDFVTVQYWRVDVSGNVMEQEAVQVDVGAGSEQLQTVVAPPVAAPQQVPVYVEVVPAPEMPFYSETRAPVNPYDPNSPVYRPPENPTPQPTYVAPPAPTGSTAPVVYYSGGQQYTYYQPPQSTASPTQDLIGYGVLDTGGNPVPVYDANYWYWNNIEAQYG